MSKARTGLAADPCEGNTTDSLDPDAQPSLGMTRA
jgi:hypothetical protein